MKHVISRRKACAVALGNLVATAACSGPDRNAVATLQASADEQDLAILDSAAVSYSEHCDLSAFAPDGTRAGEIVLPAQSGSRVAVSPDGQWLAWDNSWKALPPPVGKAEEPFKITLIGPSRTIRRLCPRVTFAFPIAISSNAKRLALSAVNTNPEPPGRRLLILNGNTGEIEFDLTDWAPRNAPKEPCNHGFSASGDRLLVALLDGKKRSFGVLDVPARKLVLEGSGDFPSLAPDGERVAYIDDRHRAIVLSLSTGSRKTLLDGWWRVTGISAWSPDGKYLLVGATRLLSFTISLLAVECATNRFAQVMDIGKPAGWTYDWIKRSLLGFKIPPQFPCADARQGQSAPAR